jgi:hypothetical protein
MNEGRDFFRWSSFGIRVRKLEILGEGGGNRSSGAEARGNFVGFMRGLKPPPPSGSSFFAKSFDAR